MKKIEELPLHKETKDIIKRCLDKSKSETPIKTKKKKELWPPSAAIPNEICRVSPFFPLEKKEIKKRIYLKKKAIVDNAWGKLIYSGFKLTTYEEDILLAILSLLDDPGKRTLTKVGNMETFMYKGPIAPIIKLAGLTRCKTSYDFVLNTCELFMSSILELQIFKNSPTNDQKEIAYRTITNIMILVHDDKEKNKHTFIINPFFYNLYRKGNFSIFDIKKRLSIKSNIGKSLYRFVISQEKDWKGHYLTLSNALNINENIPNFKKKDRIKTAIKELIALKILSNKSNITNNIATVIKHPLSNSKKKIKSEWFSG